MEVQHVNVKIFAQGPVSVDLNGAIAVFHRWIQEGAVPGLLIDVADYRHVPDGPGVMLIAHEANYSLDLTDGRLGLLYNRKSAEEGAFAAKLQHSYDAALAAARLLEREAAFRGKLQFLPGECEVIFNDRLLTPNNEETFRALEPELRAFFGKLWGTNDLDLEHVGEPRDRLRVRAAARLSAPAAGAASRT